MERLVILLAPASADTNGLVLLSGQTINTLSPLILMGAKRIGWIVELFTAILSFDSIASGTI